MVAGISPNRIGHFKEVIRNNSSIRMSRKIIVTITRKRIKALTVTVARINILIS